MDDVNSNEPQDQHHSLPEPERRTMYSEAEKKRKRKTLIWSIAGVLIVAVVIVFSLAFVNSTGGRGSSSSAASASNARDPVFDDDALPDGDGGGLDFDYGEGDGDSAAVVDPYNDESYSASYSSADDGGSYNIKSDDLTDAPTADDATYEPTYDPTTKPTIGEAHLGIPTYEPTMAGTTDDTPDASAEVSEETSGPFDYDALDAFSMSMSSSYDQEDEPMSGQVKEANADDNGGAGGSLQQSGSYSDFSSSYDGSGSAALGARQRRRRLYRNRRRVMQTGAAKK